jgi:hypothetical protein
LEACARRHVTARIAAVNKARRRARRSARFPLSQRESSGGLVSRLSRGRPVCGEHKSHSVAGSRAAGRGVAAEPPNTRFCACMARLSRVADTKLESQSARSRRDGAQYGCRLKTASVPRRSLGKRPSKCRASGNGPASDGGRAPADGDAATARQHPTTACARAAAPAKRGRCWDRPAVNALRRASDSAGEGFARVATACRGAEFRAERDFLREGQRPMGRARRFCAALAAVRQGQGSVVSHPSQTHVWAVAC